MSRNKSQLRIVARSSPGKTRSPHSQAHPIVSPRWLLGALALTALAAVFCAWATLCLLFWQGSWQLLYHPSSKISSTPVGAGLPFDPVGFAATDTGQPRLQGWWIPAAPQARFSRYTVLYLHSQNGDLGDAVDALARLHGAGVNVFAFDYRGYGQSQFAHPSEAHWRQDANRALDYLTATRHIDPRTIVLDGDGLGANLALEIAAAHPSLAGVVLESPLLHPMSAVFDDARAHLVPARLLDRDRYDLDSAAAALRIPSLWILPARGNGAGARAAYKDVSASKMLVWLSSEDGDREFSDACSRWLDGLSAH